MFSAIYLVCFPGEPCEFFVDKFPYPTHEECTVGAVGNILRNSNEIAKLGIPLPTVDYQCVGWDQA